MRSSRRNPERWLLVPVALLPLVVVAGSLEPPGPPAPTMKTLDQVEPRMPVHAADLPLTITASGSYYLAEDIDMPAGGITIQASNVTVDLAGFRFRGNVPGDGIAASGAIENVTIRNGFVIGWFEDGIDLGGVTEVHVIDVHASRNFGRGIVVGDDGRVEGSAARFNSGYGISTGNRGQVVGCQARGNAAAGISVGINSLVSHSISNGNIGNGIDGGLYTTVTDSQASSNETGISVDRGIVSGCTASQNVVDGIHVSFNSVVRDNLAAGNTGAGIKVATGEARVEGNSVVGNGIGIEVTSAGSTIFRNTARANSPNYSIVGGNDVGPIGSAAASTSPWANIAF